MEKYVITNFTSGMATNTATNMTTSMTSSPKTKVVIAGGGTAGWMSAAALCKLLHKNVEVTLIESEQIGTVGVGEATIPPIRTFHKLLGINEQQLMKATHATFKLGIEFESWRDTPNNDFSQKQNRNINSYIHSFGITGKECWAGEFHHFWLHGLTKGINTPFGDYCYELQAAKQNKFSLPSQQLPQGINYAYHLDAGRYADFLKAFCQSDAKTGVKNAVNRINATITGVNLNPVNGHIDSLTLDNGQTIAGDLFIDCTGFKGLFIEKALHTGFDDWSHYLPCDSAVALQTESDGPLLPYTRSIAHQSGWQWRIPLQHRVGNGLVYCSRYLNDEQAIETLKNNVKGHAITQPRVIKFQTGRRRKGWQKNCVAMGLASGFIEPLESTSIHLIMTAIIRLLRLFPFNGIEQSLIDEYNQKLDSELNSIRDFIVLHYHVTNRQDTPFWRHCQQMEIPASLKHKIELFRNTGRVFLDDGDIFRVDSWVQVMLGQGLTPKHYHRITDTMSDKEFKQFMSGILTQVNQGVSRLPSHEQFVSNYCLATDD